MADEKDQSPPNSPSDGTEDQQKNDALDQEALDQMVADSQPVKDDTEQLESILENFDESSTDEPLEDRISDSQEEVADIDTLTNNMEALLDRLESLDDQIGSEDTEKEDPNDLLFQKENSDTSDTLGLDVAGTKTKDSEEIHLSTTGEIDNDSTKFNTKSTPGSEEERKIQISPTEEMDDATEDQIKKTLNVPIIENKSLDLESPQNQNKSVKPQEEEIENLDSPYKRPVRLEDLDSETTHVEMENEAFDSPFEENLLVGVEGEVAQILATGEAIPSQEEEKVNAIDDDILDDFRSVQETFQNEEDINQGNPTLLIVDDDPNNKNTFKEILTAESYDFVEVETSERFPELFQTREIDLILLNLDNDTEDSFELLNQILTKPESSSIPVIVNSTQNNRIESALKMGATDYFSRPLGLLELEFQVPLKISDRLKLHQVEILTASSIGETIQESKDTSPFVPNLDSNEELNFNDFEFEAEKKGKMSSASPLRRLVPISDQKQLLNERNFSNDFRSQTKARRMPLFLLITGMLGLMVFAGGFVMKTFRDKQQEPLSHNSIPTPLPVLKPPIIPQMDYEMARHRIRRLDTYQQQAENFKGRIQNTVNSLANNNGAWWSPWRVVRESGASLNRLVNGRRVSEILDAFKVDKSVVEASLQSQSTINYLASVGFNLKGKKAKDLNARETFELLSSSEIKDPNQVVDILSSLADDTATQARKRDKQKRGTDQTAINIKPLESNLKNIDQISFPIPSLYLGKKLIRHGSKPSNLKYKPPLIS